MRGGTSHFASVRNNGITVSIDRRTVLWVPNAGFIEVRKEGSVSKKQAVNDPIFYVWKTSQNASGVKPILPCPTYYVCMPYIGILPLHRSAAYNLTSPYRIRFSGFYLYPNNLNPQAFECPDSIPTLTSYRPFLGIPSFYARCGKCTKGK